MGDREVAGVPRRRRKSFYVAVADSAVTGRADVLSRLREIGAVWQVDESAWLLTCDLTYEELVDRLADGVVIEEVVRPRDEWLLRMANVQSPFA